MLRKILFSAVALFFATALAYSAEDRDAKVHQDRAEVQSAGHWIYNDLPRGFAEAKKTGKPMLVVLRCIP